MTGRKLLFAVSLLLPALPPVCAFSAELLFDSLNDPYNTVDISGKTCFFG